MTKEKLAELIACTVKNCIESGEPSIAEEKIIGLLDTLEPRDRERFAKWGTPDEKSTANKCW